MTSKLPNQQPNFQILFRILCTSSLSRPSSQALQCALNVAARARQLRKFLGPKTDFRCPHRTGINHT